MIDGNRLIELLGYSSAFPELDRRLTEMNLLKRPKGSDLVQYVLFNPMGLVLIFSASVTYKEKIGEPANDGRWIFSGVHFYNENQNGKNEKFPGVLPYGLDFELNRSDLVAKLGPLKLNRERDGFATCSFPQASEIVVISSTGIEQREARWFKVEKIEESHRERGAA